MPNISQGSVLTHLWCVALFIGDFITDLVLSLLVKYYENWYAAKLWARV